jgi:hypothetical protein
MESAEFDCEFKEAGGTSQKSNRVFKAHSLFRTMYEHFKEEKPKNTFLKMCGKFCK